MDDDRPSNREPETFVRGERPDPVDIPPGCRFHPRCPLAFEKHGWRADEVAEQLESLKKGGLLADSKSIEVLNAAMVRIAPARGTEETLAAELRNLVFVRRDEDLPLKGIAEVRGAGGFVEVALHNGSEPELVEIGPGNAVACHLVTPAATIPESVTA